VHVRQARPLPDVPVGDVHGLLEAVPAFCARQAAGCLERGIDVSALPISHVAVRARTWRNYLTWRQALEPLCTGNLENVWNGRPISKLALTQPVGVGQGQRVPLIELIPPFHQRVYRMGLEHVGYVLGEQVDEFGRRFHDVLTGQQFQSPVNSPYYLLFPGDYTHVKFYRWSLMEVCLREGRSFAGFEHAAWDPADPDAGPYEVW
jgi:predicted metalloenzyme YecM